MESKNIPKRPNSHNILRHVITQNHYNVRFIVAKALDLT